MEYKADILGFDNWMANTVKSIYYTDIEEMELAHAVLTIPLGQSRNDYDFGPGDKLKKRENEFNTTSTRKIRRILKNPFRRKQAVN